MIPAGTAPDLCRLDVMHCRPEILTAYEYLAHHDYGSFVYYYGVPLVVFWVLGTLVFHLMGKVFEWHYRKKRQRERMKELPGVYK